MSFSFARWFSGIEPERTRAEALAKALEVAEELVAAPGLFQEYAEKFSDDPSTRSVGGHLGAVRASFLGSIPQLLDCVQQIGPGEVTPVVETSHGFHILKLHPTAVPELVEGQEIVIGHQRAEWLEVSSGVVPTRSPEEARELAERIYAEALKSPERFTDLVEQYSEHPSKLVSGDVGRWSTREASPFPREVHALSRLKPGEIAPPLETQLGFKILKRTRPIKRQQLGLQFVEFPFGRRDPGSKKRALTEAQTLLGELRQGRTTLEQSRGKRCCAESLHVLEGRGAPELTKGLREVPVGAWTPQPIEVMEKWVIGKRVAVDLGPIAEAATRLPSPTRPDTATLLMQTSGVGPVSWWSLLEKFAPQLHLEPEQAAHYVSIHRALDGAAEPPEHPLAEIKALLGPERFAEYMRAAEEIVKLQLLAHSDPMLSASHAFH